MYILEDFEAADKLIANAKEDLKQNSQKASSTSNINEPGLYEEILKLCEKNNGGDFQHYFISENHYHTYIESKAGILTGRASIGACVYYNLEESSCDAVLAGKQPALIFDSVNYGGSW